MKNKSLLLYMFYILILIFSFIYAKNVLDRDNVKLNGKKTEKKVIDQKIVDPTLIVEYNNNPTTYSLSLKNTDTVFDFLNDLWKDQGFYFQKYSYLHNLKFDYINRQKAPEGLTWRLFLNDTDITDNVTNLHPEDKAIYTFKLVAINDK